MATTLVPKQRCNGAPAAAPRAPWLTPARIIASGQLVTPLSSKDAPAPATVHDDDCCDEHTNDTTCDTHSSAAAVASRSMQPQRSAPWLNRARTVAASAPQAASTAQPLPLGAFTSATNDNELMSCSDDDEEEEADAEKDASDDDEDYQDDEDDDEVESDDSDDEMQSVMATDSADDSQHRSGLDSFHCASCDIKFAYKHSFTRHQALMHVSTARPFECAKCRLAFRTERQLQTHAQSHSGSFSSLVWYRFVA